MNRKMILTLAGPDQVGIVKRVTRLVYDRSGNVEGSRMARLGGEFTMLMLIGVPDEGFAALEEDLQTLTADGFSITTRETSQADPGTRVGWLPFNVRVDGADHEGIIARVTEALAERGINIESMDTGMSEAPMSGTPLFTMDAIVLVPPEIQAQDLQKDLGRTADELNVDVKITPYRG